MKIKVADVKNGLQTRCIQRPIESCDKCGGMRAIAEASATSPQLLYNHWRRE